MFEKVAPPVLMILAMLSAGGGARADTPAKASLILFPVTGPAGSPTLTAELEQALKKVGKAVERSALALDELMMAVECSEVSSACLKKTGESIQAAGLIIGTARPAGDKLELALRWFHVTRGGDSGKSIAVLPAAGNRAEALLGAVRDLFGIKAPQAGPRWQTGGLSITASIPDVEIFLDGQPRGTTPIELRNLKEGTYQIEARREGYVAWKGEAKIKADQISKLEVEMLTSAAEGKHPGFLESIRLRTWIVSGVGLASLVGAIAVGSHMNSLQNEMDDTRGVTPEQIQQMQQLQEDGDRNALVANILFGVGGAALIAGAVMAYLDYRRGGQQAGPGSARLQLGPGAVTLDLTF